MDMENGGFWVWTRVTGSRKSKHWYLVMVVLPMVCRESWLPRSLLEAGTMDVGSGYGHVLSMCTALQCIPRWVGTQVRVAILCMFVLRPP